MMNDDHKSGRFGSSEDGFDGGDVHNESINLSRCSRRKPLKMLSPEARKLRKFFYSIVGESLFLGIVAIVFGILLFSIASLASKFFNHGPFSETGSIISMILFIGTFSLLLAGFASAIGAIALWRRKEWGRLWAQFAYIPAIVAICCALILLELRPGMHRDYFTIWIFGMVIVLGALLNRKIFDSASMRRLCAGEDEEDIAADSVDLKEAFNKMDLAGKINFIVSRTLSIEVVGTAFIVIGIISFITGYLGGMNLLDFSTEVQGFSGAVSLTEFLAGFLFIAGGIAFYSRKAWGRILCLIAASCAFAGACVYLILDARGFFDLTKGWGDLIDFILLCLVTLAVYGGLIFFLISKKTKEALRSDKKARLIVEEAGPIAVPIDEGKILSRKIKISAILIITIAVIDVINAVAVIGNFDVFQPHTGLFDIFVSVPYLFLDSVVFKGIAGLLLFMGGIGLLRLKDWGRHFSIAGFVLNIVWIIGFIIAFSVEIVFELGVPIFFALLSQSLFAFFTICAVVALFVWIIILLKHKCIRDIMIPVRKREVCDGRRKQTVQ